ncbi:late embryogenesis abundant protein At1g64065-like [Humulus lupulus]|uniref:late embryogenesis abundant protein At1g64065-like n=1 Tax=Humulus lupulus TaxID=3486 RepID=UPI002B40D3AF|nr:late embryogenesis abundant protein At1g64065-like [Humulus lupulus]
MVAEKNEEHPLAKADDYTRSDQESGDLSAEELKRKKMIKIATYVVAFVIFQVIVITTLALTIMKVKSPVLTLDNIQLQTQTTTTKSPSFDRSFSTQVRVKNTNFGPYKFQATTLNFTYAGATVGQVVIPKGKAGMMSTKKINDVIVMLSSTKLPSSAELESELSLSSSARMNGKVELMSIMKKKKKSITINCTITIDVAAKNVRSLQCWSRRPRTKPMSKPKKTIYKPEQKKKTTKKA